MDSDTVKELAAADSLNAIGCTDKVEQEQLFAAWNLLREFGAQAPATTKPAHDWKSDLATDAQKSKIRRDCDDKALAYPDFDGLTKGQASEIIEQIAAGSYDAERWQTVPF